MTAEEWEALPLPERCRRWQRVAMIRIQEMEMVLNKFERENPSQYKSINERRELIMDLVASNEYFRWLISTYENQQEKEPTEFTLKSS